MNLQLHQASIKIKQGATSLSIHTANVLNQLKLEIEQGDST